MTSPKILFFGNSPFSKIVLREIQSLGFSPREVFPGFENEAWDLFIVASYGKIISKEILAIPKYGSLNVHPSLLPRLRGAAPLQWTILNNDIEAAGVSIMKMDELMDHGPLLTQEKYDLSPETTFQELHDTLARRGGELLAGLISPFIEGSIELREQDHRAATLARKIKTEDALLIFQEMSRTLIDRKIRALNPEPGAFAWFDTGTKKIRLLIKSGSLAGEAYIPKLVQPEGKKEMSWDAFKRGYSKGSLL